MTSNGLGHIGESVLRVEDGPLLRGLGCFLDDVPELPATIHLGFVRSPYPHARIVGIDANAAKALPGVVDVLTAEHLGELIKPIQADFDKPGFKITHRHALATDRVRFVGDAVAVVLAETPYVVDDAVELVAVDYEPLAAVAEITTALAPDAPVVHDYIENNIVFENEQKPDGFDAVFDGADRILEGGFTTARVATVSMETRGCVASYDRRRGALTVWSSTQLPHILRTALCEFLGFSPNSTPGQSGRFGSEQVAALRRNQWPLSSECARTSVFPRFTAGIGGETDVLDGASLRAKMTQCGHGAEFISIPNLRVLQMRCREGESQGQRF